MNKQTPPPNDPELVLKNGQTLGDYLIVKPLQRGGMGQIYVARHQQMHREVALKVISKTILSSVGALKRFEREIRFLAQLQHPNIVTAFDAGEKDGILYLVMELIQGTDLSSMVKAQGPVGIEQTIQLTIQAAAGLSFIHEKGIVHRDVKPHNLFLDQTGVVKVLDMGLARIIDNDDSLANSITNSGAFLGTVDFLSPEQAVNPHQVDARSDIYSLGCTLFYLLIGHPPFRCSSIPATLLAHREQPIPDLVSINADFRPMVPIIEQMMAKNPKHRFTSMKEVQDALRQVSASTHAFSSNNSLTPTLPTSHQSSRPVTPSRRGVVPYLIGVGLIIILAIALFLVSQQGPGKGQSGSTGIPFPPVIPFPEDGSEAEKIQWLITALKAKNSDIDVSKIKYQADGKSLSIEQSALKDLTPLEEIDFLYSLDLADSNVTDLTPVTASKELGSLHLGASAVESLEPLKQLKELQYLYCENTEIDSIDALRSLSLIDLTLSKTKVSDLEPLAGHPLQNLEIGGTRVQSLKPVMQCSKLQSLQCDFPLAKQATFLQKHPSLKTINGISVSDFWK